MEHNTANALFTLNSEEDEMLAETVRASSASIRAHSAPQNDAWQVEQIAVIYLLYNHLPRFVIFFLSVSRGSVTAVRSLLYWSATFSSKKCKVCVLAVPVVC